MKQQMSVSAWFVSFLLLLPLAGAQAQTYEVAEHGFMRLSSKQSHLNVRQLTLKPAATMLVPSEVTQLIVQNLSMGAAAHLIVAPRDEVFELIIAHATFASGSVISARGSDGDIGVPGGNGTALKLVVADAQITNLTVDTRGGNGGDGWSGLNGEAGRDAACWGKTSNLGGDGGDGGDGLDGGNGGDITVQLGRPSWQQRIKFIQIAGTGGAAGDAGTSGAGGKQASCMVYSFKASNDGQSGHRGRAAKPGEPGVLNITTAH